MKNCPGLPSSAPRSSRNTTTGSADDATWPCSSPNCNAYHDASPSIPIRSWSESADSARAFAIACTAAAAPAIVVMQGTRAASAASRIR
jgi:hypothetical protein